jgi:aryl-alcohol dehydrogenase-like predicted oxidoreductase
LIFGGSTIGDGAYTTPEAVDSLLKLAKSLGIHEIDTAALYPVGVSPMGESERLLGEVGAGNQGFTIDTKILIPSRDANGTLEAGKIEDSVAKSLGRLKLPDQKVNVLHRHAPDYATQCASPVGTGFLSGKLTVGTIEGVDP